MKILHIVAYGFKGDSFGDLEFEAYESREEALDALDTLRDHGNFDVIEITAAPLFKTGATRT